MSNTAQPPVYYPPPPPPRSGGRVFLVLMLIGSLVLNVLFCAGMSVSQLPTLDFSDNLRERTRSGSPLSADKVAVVQLNGLIMEGLTEYVHKQVERAAGDDAVKAVVLRVESPGGSITASDELLSRLEQLRTGTMPRFKGRSSPKPLVVSMGSVAASGGYYVSMAAPPVADHKSIFAERTTITGSIGVYASLPNAKGTADKIGFRMDMIRAGDIKGSGSPFHDMTPQERQPWQDMVDSAYRQFLVVVETGRPGLKGKLTEPLFAPRPVGVYDDRGNRVKDDGGTYTRKLADGGIFTAKEALEYGLIDAIGTVDDAVNEVAKQAGLGDYRVVVYERAATLLSALTGAQTTVAPVGLVDVAPRLWYLLPESEAAARVAKP
jgi:protease-4